MVMAGMGKRGRRGKLVGGGEGVSGVGLVLRDQFKELCCYLCVKDTAQCIERNPKLSVTILKSAYCLEVSYLFFS